MRAHQSFDRRLQIQVERGPHRAAELRVSRHDCVHKVRCQSRGIDASDFWRLRKERLLVARDHSQINKPPERSPYFAIRFLGMPPRVETGWRLRQTRQENCFAQREIVR